MQGKEQVATMQGKQQHKASNEYQQSRQVANNNDQGK
jgi:hypothetical protein